MSIQRAIATIGTIAAVTLGASDLALAHGSGGVQGNQPPGWHQGWHMGPGMMGQGQMAPYMMNPGQMGQGMMGQGQRGQGMMGQGMMGPGMMGPGMMGQGMMGYGQMGQGMMQPLRRDLAAEDVQHMIEHRLAWQGNPHVKVGEVIEKDEDTIIAEIVTQEGSLVQRLEINRHTGWMRPAQ